ncbi:MAG: TRAP transporter small permease [Proteobacteria bacterium]|nr:TRAP transporter small permease [Pseudomonadota bacterium]
MSSTHIDRALAFCDRLHQGLRTLLVLLLAFYFALVLTQVFFRYVLNESLFWAEEVVRYSLVWSVLLGSAVVAYQRAHIRIELLELLLPPAARRVVHFLSDALTLAFILILMVTGIQFVERTIFQHSASLGAPMWAVYGAVPTAAALETIFTLSAWWRGRPAAADPEAMI